MSAYYKENKDLIQRRVYTNVPAPITTYETYGNLDFGTTKGFSFQFDKRRTNNLEFSATYTLQFADGSGSDANSSGVSIPGASSVTSTHFLLTKDTDLLPISITGTNQVRLMTDQRLVVSTF